MMSSVIPARLQFQCGHAALVSLPRVKGESSAQRTERIAREKSAAQARACDFCPPLTVAEVAQAIVIVAAQPELASLPVLAYVAEPVVPVSEPEPPVVVVSEPEPPVVPAPVPVQPVATHSEPISPKTARRAARPRRQRSAPVVRAAAQSGHVASYRFLVRFRTEAVVEATDIRDALRKVEALGATEVLALTRHG